MFGRKPYPILPTSESDTLTFMQKLDMLEYKVSEMNNKIYEIETSLATKSSVSATASDDVIQTITIDGTTLDVPQGTEVSATGSEGTLETLTVDGTTYNVPQGGEAGEIGSAITSGGLTHSMFQWRLINDIFVIEFILMDVNDSLDNEGITMQLRDPDNNNWTGLDGMTIKSSLTWLHDFGIGGSHDYAPANAEIELSVSSNGSCNIRLPKGFTLPTGYTPFTGNTALQDIGGIPIVFTTIGLI